MTIPVYHAIGGQLVRKGRGSSAPPPPPPAVTYRFPGDTNPKVTGTWYWGIDEYDQDPTQLTAGEAATPETLSGTPVGFIRFYYSTTDTPPSALVPPNGSAIKAIQAQHAKGHVPWVSVFYNDWSYAASGACNTNWLNFITYVEEQCNAPVWYTQSHEPENNTVSHGGTAGTEAEFAAHQAEFRSVMDQYANAHGGVANYKWKNLAFGPIFIPQTYARTGVSTTYGIDNYMQGLAHRTFDFMGCDPYVGRYPSDFWPFWFPYWADCVTWCESKGYPIGISEFGIQHRDPDAATKMQQWYDKCLDGSHDIFACAYYNSSVGHTTAAEEQWILDNVSNGNLLDKYVALAQDPRSIHFWDVAPPGSSTNYARPAGV